jgi:pimeloyl-ACP methyl ester carboxylesterase
VLKWLFKGLLVLVLALTVVIAAGLGYREWRQYGAEKTLVIDSPDGIDERMFVEVGGTEQWVTIRGQDRNNPVVLVLHGGPGSAITGLASAFLPWEKDFVVVQWDQPGAGRTFRAAGRSIDPGLTIESMARDGNELAEYLTRHLETDKIILLGWSWGSALGVHMVKMRPDLFAAYVGTGQVVNMQEGEALAYANVLEKARQRQDAQALEDLAAIGPPPYDSIAELEAQRGWAAMYELDRSLVAGLILPQLVAPRITLADMYDLARGSLASTAHFAGPDLRGPMSELDLHKLGPEFAIPMFVVQGLEDDFTPAALGRDYVDYIRAPQQAFIPIEGAGHMAITEYSDEFLAIMRERIRPLAMRVVTQ